MRLSKTLFQTFICLFFFIFSISTVSAIEVAGVQIEENISITGVDGVLKLNGAAIRSKFFFDIYVGALYLTEKNNNAQSILQKPQANRVLMHFLYGEVSKEKLVNAWLDGFEENTSADIYKQLTSRLTAFNKMFMTLHKGDVVLLDYIPSTGTRVTIKGEVKGMIKGEDFNRALLSVWLGKSPVTDSLKEGMLGL